MGIENPVHLLFIAVVALLVLGPRRLPDLAKAVGRGVREFREAMGGGGQGDPAQVAQRPAPEAGAPADEPSVAPPQPVQLAPAPASADEQPAATHEQPAPLRRDAAGGG